MTAIEVRLPSVLQGDELEEVWDNMMSFSNPVMHDVQITPVVVHEPKVGEYTIIPTAA